MLVRAAGFAIIAATLALSGCATKRYPIATPLSPTEATLMTCRELAIEFDRIETTRTQITNTAQTDWRSVAGFLGDYGIGNAMAKSEAEAALANRSETIRQAQARRGCVGMSEPVAAPTPAAAAPAAAATPSPVDTPATPAQPQ